MEPTNENLQELIESLLDKARKGRLEWFMAASPFAYSVAFPNSSVTVRRNDARGASDLYTISILNANGEEVESFSAAVYHKPFEMLNAGAGRLLQELFDLARRKTLGAAETISEIRKELARV